MAEWLTPDIQDRLIDGVVVTVIVTLVTSVASMILGATAAVARGHRRRAVRLPSTIFIDLFRNVPALILIIFFAFALPNVFSPDLRRSVFFDNPVVEGLGNVTGLPLPYYAVAASIALSLNTGAHLAEIMRSGIATIPATRVEVARSLGASRLTVLRTVVLPDGLRACFPAVSTRLVHNMKNTALVSFVAVPDLFSAIQGSITKTFRATEFLVLAAVLYLALSAIMTAGLGLIEARLRRGRPVRRTLGV